MNEQLQTNTITINYTKDTFDDTAIKAELRREAVLSTIEYGKAVLGASMHATERIARTAGYALFMGIVKMQDDCHGTDVGEQLRG